MMKNFTLIGFLLWCFTAQSQSITYFNEDGDTISVNDNWNYYIQTSQREATDSIWVEEKFDTDAHLIYQKHFYYDKSDTTPVNHGQYKLWNKNGQILRAFNYQNGNFQDTIKTFWDNGQLKREELYDNDSLIAGQCFDSLGNVTICPPFLRQPSFIGGISEMNKFLINNISYPKVALKRNIEGIVKILFVVEKDGSLSNITIHESPHKTLSEEGLRVVKLMIKDKWLPGYQFGERVRVKMLVPIKFKL